MTAARNKTSAPLDAALALEKNGDLAGAEASYRAILEGKPGNPDALVLLGMLLRKSGRAKEAVRHIERAIAAAPKQGRKPPPAWRVALACANRDSGNPVAALAIFDALVKEAPGVPEPLFLRAGMLQRLERHEEALRDFGALLKRAPNNGKIVAGTGRSLRALGRLQEATEAFCKAAALDPEDAESALAAGTLLGRSGRIEPAIEVLRRAHKLQPADIAIANTLVDVLLVANSLDEAERIARKLEEKNRFNPSVMMRIAQIQVTRGEMNKARKAARRALAIGPGFVPALLLLSEIDTGHQPEDLLLQIDGQLRQGTRDTSELVALYFAAACVNDELGRGEETFRCYAAANRLLKDQFRGMNRAYDRRQTEKFFENIIEAFGPGGFGEPGGSLSESPVFIVGMPRSGTSLTEQILASHPTVTGAGELRVVGEIATRLVDGRQYPDNLTAESVTMAARDYLDQVSGIAYSAARVTDKMPGNFMHLGLIARMFPKARIIHCRRDPMDTCVSCFAQNFGGGLSWSCDLEDLAHQYCQYRQIMAHWRAVLPAGTMLEIDYEDTVADLETQARRLVDFVGLGWDDACLDFHKTERAVVTASREQVRNPIYKTSVGRWKRYGDGVAPLARALAACGCGPDGDDSR